MPVFKQAIIHYPKDEKMLIQISKDIASFRCLATMKYIQSLNFNDNQIEALYKSLEEEITKKTALK